MKFKVAVCDDEQIVRSDLISKIRAINPELEITEFDSSAEFAEKGGDYDIVFLDIEMPQLSGMEVASRIREKNEDNLIIFLTSHTEFMPDAFKVKAFRFLNKPVNPESLDEAVSCAEKELLKNGRVIVKDHSSVTIIKYNDIVCIEAFGDGTYIHTKNDVLCSSMPFKNWLEQLGEVHFFQVHRSYAVALKYIRNIDKTEVEMNYLKRPVPVSRRKFTELKTAFYNYIMKNAQYV